MRIRLRRIQKSSINFEDTMFVIITNLIFASACFNVIYQRVPILDSVYNRLFIFSIYGIVCICVLQLFVDFTETKKLNYVTVIMLSMFFYEAFVSWVMGLFLIRALVVDSLSWVLVFCVSYCYSNKRDINKMMLNISLIIWGFVYCILMMPNISLHISGLDLRGGIISPLYYCFGFVGLILLCLPKIWKVVFSIVIGLMVLFSAKRTGVLVIVIGFFFYFMGRAFIEDKRTKRIKQYICMMFIVIIACLVVSWVIEKYNIGILDRMAAIATDGGSGRDEIWKSVIVNFKRSDILHKIFGYGFHAVPELLRPYNRYLFAHNGFLEVLFDFGILGLIIMISGIMWLGINTLKMQKERYFGAPIMMYSMVVIILLSMFGYFFEESRFVMPMAIVCGVCMGDYKRKIKRIGRSYNECNKKETISNADVIS